MKKILPVLLALLFMVLIGAAAVGLFLYNRYSETFDKLNYEQTMGLSDGEYAVILNNKVQEFKAIEHEGAVYLDAELVISSVNTRFYWDKNERILIYTKPESIVKAYLDDAAYHIGTEIHELSYVPFKEINGTTYIAVDYISEYTNWQADSYTAPRRLVIKTEWGEKTTVRVSEDTVVRFRGGVKAEVLRETGQGEVMTYLDAYDDWTEVVTDDGYIGYVANKYLDDPVGSTDIAPQFEEEVFKNQLRDHKINLAWHQVMTQEANGGLTSAMAEVSGVNVISPTWFSFQDTEGNVRSIATRDYVDTAHSMGLEVWGLFSNEFEGLFNGALTDEVLAYTTKRERTVNQIVNLALENNLDGINLDFELILESGANNYIQFVRELSVACRLNNLVFSIDNYVPLYTQHYDRAEQGTFADYLIIMGYDEYNSSSIEPGPVASIGFVEQGIQDTLVSVPSEKVINAIPLYSRVWATSDDGVFEMFSCGMDEALGYLTNRGITPEYKGDLGLNYGTYVSDVDGRRYEIWLEDTTAVEKKMELIQQYELAGVASWKLGFENADVWSVISKYLK